MCSIPIQDLYVPERINDPDLAINTYISFYNIPCDVLKISYLDK